MIVLLVGFTFVVCLNMGWTIEVEGVRIGEVEMGGLLVGIAVGLAGAILEAVRAGRESPLTRTIYRAILGGLLGAGAGGFLALVPYLGARRAFLLILPSVLGVAGAWLGWLAGTGRPVMAVFGSVLGAVIFALVPELIGVGAGVVSLILAMAAGFVVWCIRTIGSSIVK